MSAKSPSSMSRGCLASVSTEPLASRQTYLSWLLILAILHCKIYVTDNDLKRLGRRKVKRQERNKRVVLDLMDHRHRTTTKKEKLVPAGRWPCSAHETGCSLSPPRCRAHLVHLQARVDRDRDTVRYPGAHVCRCAVGQCPRKEMTRRDPFST